MKRRTPLPKWCRIVRERCAEYAPDAGAKVQNPRDAVVLLSRLELEEQECFVAILLNAQHRAIAVAEVTRGTVNSSLVAPREVFRLAVAMNASAVILAHNHPSGDVTPSIADRQVTEQLAAAGRVLDIPVHDHIIVAPGRYTSFAEAGLL